MLKKVLFFILLISILKNQAQFRFTGRVNSDFSNATAYLSIVNDCNKKSLFLTEHILQEYKIDSSNSFTLKGDFLVKQNRIYKIHIDNCNLNVTDYKHLLNHCENSKEILFIANNADSIHFPLNDLAQMFCDMEQSSTSNMAISKIEALQEESLSNLQQAKSDLQRENIYKNHYSSLQEFAKTFDEPIAELYAFYLYASDNSFSKDFYLADLKKSDYYNNLLNRLEEKYPNSSYTKQYRLSLTKDRYPLLQTKSNTFRNVAIGLGLFLLISLVYNFLHFKKQKNISKDNEIINYKTVLTSQEQKVFELMLENSNKEIADKLFVSLSTVKSHINNIYSKLDISSRNDVARFFD